MSLTDKTKRWLKRKADISLRGKTAVVTGANSGVGFKTAETLLYLGADVILACRNPQRAAEVQRHLAGEYPLSAVSVMELDLADFSSIDAFVQRLGKRDVDIFVNNAGAIHHPGERTRDGWDLVMGTNYYGVYYLTEKLLPYLQTLRHEVTYINTISLVHRFATVRYDDFYYSGRNRSLALYARSKLCLARYSYYMARKLEGDPVRMYMNHPGIAITPLGLNWVRPGIARLEKLGRPLFNSPEKSSLSVAYILANRFPVGSIIGPVWGCGGWGYPKRNRTCRKVTTGAEELMAFTRRELSR